MSNDHCLCHHKEMKETKELPLLSRSMSPRVGCDEDEVKEKEVSPKKVTATSVTVETNLNDDEKVEEVGNREREEGEEEGRLIAQLESEIDDLSVASMEDSEKCNHHKGMAQFAEFIYVSDDSDENDENDPCDDNSDDREICDKTRTTAHSEELLINSNDDGEDACDEIYNEYDSGCDMRVIYDGDDNFLPPMVGMLETIAEEDDYDDDDDWDEVVGIEEDKERMRDAPHELDGTNTHGTTNGTAIIYENFFQLSFR